MPPEWLPSPRGDKAMSDYNTGRKKAARAATKICQTTKRSKRHIKVFPVEEFSISPGKTGQFLCFQ
jgi:hypothetical protein